MGGDISAQPREAALLQWSWQHVVNKYTLMLPRMLTALPSNFADIAANNLLPCCTRDGEFRRPSVSGESEERGDHADETFTQYLQHQQKWYKTAASVAHTV